MVFLILLKFEVILWSNHIPFLIPLKVKVIFLSNDIPMLNLIEKEQEIGLEIAELIWLYENQTWKSEDYSRGTTDGGQEEIYVLTKLTKG